MRKKMRLWILRSTFLSMSAGSPWDPDWDTAFGFVVRASTEIEARTLADAKAGDENKDGGHPWQDPAWTSCQELTPAGAPGVVLQDGRWA